MLAAKVEDMINTVVRQIAFYHVRARASTTERRERRADRGRIGEFWLSVQSESLGPAIRLNAGLRDLLDLYFALRPFAVLRLRLRVRRLPGELALRSYERAPGGFEDRYLDMLRAGGTKHHKELLAPFGLDATDPGFWSMGLKVIEDMIVELEALEV